MTTASSSPESPDEQGRLPSAESERESSELPLHLSHAWRQAMRRRDALTLRRLAEEAGGRKDRTAVVALSMLIERPRVATDWWALRQYRKRAWVWTRIAAVNALGQIGDPDAVPALTDALFDPDPAVREAAAFVLPGYGSRPLRPLIRALRTRSDWQLQSMKLLIGALGALKSRRATPVLLHVLAEQLPADPGRWARQAFLRPLGILSTITLCWWFTCLIANPPTGGTGWLLTLLALLVRSVVPFLFSYIVLVCLIFVPLLNRVAVREREELIAEALQAIATIKDARAIPTVTESIVGSSTRANHIALTTLQTLLSLVTTEDDPHVPTHTRQQLVWVLRVASQLNRPDAELEIVRALEHVGDGEAAEVVERIAQRGGTQELRREAARVLPILRARKRRKQAAGSLLRPANSPAATAAELLRPSSTPPTTSPDELLRPPDAE